MLFLLSNWKLLSSIAVALMLSVYGYQLGAENVEKKWDAAAAIERKLSTEALERDRQAAQQRSEELEAQLAKQRQNVVKLNRRLSNEIQNPVYRACVVSPDGVSIANDYRSGAPAK